MFWSDLDQRLRQHLSTATREAVLIAPFIKASALTRLLRAIPPNVPVRAFTRWRAEEVASGVSDLEVVDLIEARPGAELHLCDELHAKIYIVDGNSALLGSANVTAAALGLSARPNLEILHDATLSGGTARLFMAALETRSRPATRAEADNIRVRAEALRAKLPLEVPTPLDAQGEGTGQARAPWLPKFRSPERLYRLAKDEEWIMEAAPSEPALLDLVALAPPLDEGEPAFDAHIRSSLINSSVVAALEAFLAKPQRFGALTQWLRDVFPDATHDVRQEAGQTLVRWLTYFAPDRFEVGVPGSYSEVLRLRQGG